MPAEKWDAGLYDARHAFVWEKAKGVVELLAAKSGERVLDLGCGTGTLTAEIAACGAQMVGVDRSFEMIEAARKKFPAIQFEVSDARALPFSAEFDAVFSNAALHWIPEAGSVVEGVSRSLKRGGRFVAEFGGNGNVRNVVAALESALGQLAISSDGANPWFYPSVSQYAALLEKHSLEVREASLFERPTRLEDGQRGFATWIAMFGNSFLERVPPDQRTAFIRAAEHAAGPSLWQGDHWELDYRRLRIAAWKVTG